MLAELEAGAIRKLAPGTEQRDLLLSGPVERIRNAPSVGSDFARVNR
jgi:hypothetical protein